MIKPGTAEVFGVTQTAPPMFNLGGNANNSDASGAQGGGFSQTFPCLIGNNLENNNPNNDVVDSGFEFGMD